MLREIRKKLVDADNSVVTPEGRGGAGGRG